MPDAVEISEVIQFVECPQCKGQGTEINPFRQDSNSLCTMCMGKGVVISNKQCFCSKPVQFRAEKIFYCGHTSCLTELKKIGGNI